MTYFDKRRKRKGAGLFMDDFFSAYRNLPEKMPLNIKAIAIAFKIEVAPFSTRVSGK
jgi:hypothetical protein